MMTSIEDEIVKLHEELDRLREECAGGFADHGKRIKQLEGCPKDSPKSESHIDNLYNYMKTSGLKGITYRDASIILGVSRPRVRQLVKLLKEDSRFLFHKHPQKRNSILICLRGKI